jgi:hypothetical protein
MERDPVSFRRVLCESRPEGLTESLRTVMLDGRAFIIRFEGGKVYMETAS